MSPSTREHPLPPSPARVLDGLAGARRRTLELVAPLSDEELERVHSPIMSPLVWDLGHIAAYEDLWLAHRFAGEPLLRPDLAETYDAFETPRAERGEVELLRREAVERYLEQVRTRVVRGIERLGVGDELLHELVLRHEHQHHETMLQTLELARLPDYRPSGDRQAWQAPSGPTSLSPTQRPPNAHTGLELVEVPAGPFSLGAGEAGFSYDNERPRHVRELPAFRIGRTPVTNATWLTFAEGGGYERREWWSDEGWAWKEEYDISRPDGWTTGLERTAGESPPLLGGRPVHEWSLGGWKPLDPHGPVVHVSWFEADAFARAHGMRLPTEAEWEKAATWDQHTGLTHERPWGEDGANLLDGGLYATAPVGVHPAGAAPCGALDMLGNVWEWTASHFGAYEGFVAHPYREYSEVFFGERYRVLRGGSWATCERVATPTFRNWDLPVRRQIFAGLRLADDA